MSISEEGAVRGVNYCLLNAEDQFPFDWYSANRMPVNFPQINPIERLRCGKSVFLCHQLSMEEREIEVQLPSQPPRLGNFWVEASKQMIYLVTA